MFGVLFVRISEYRCLLSVVGDRFNPVWFVESRLNVSDRRKGFFWGTCVYCGRRHYDRLPGVINNK